MKEALKYLQAGAIVPVDMETTILLVNALKEALAQPAQEPVAYLVLFEGAGKLLEFKKGNYIHGAKVEHIPLYTTPPQREWVGLTDEDKSELAKAQPGKIYVWQLNPNSRSAIMEREALKLALEAAEIGLANLTSYQSAPIGPSIHEYGQAVRALIEVREAKKALAQPVQEPYGYDWSMLEATQESLREHMARIHELEAALAQPAPPREWVGLTDEEIDVIYEQHHNQYGECESPNFGYERAIEAKLKEKNT